MVKNPPVSAGDAGDVASIPGSGRSPGGENGNPLQYSCLGNPMDKGTSQAAVHGVLKDAVQQRLAQHCKSTVLQFKKILKAAPSNSCTRHGLAYGKCTADGGRISELNPGSAPFLAVKPQAGDHSSLLILHPSS